MDNKEFNNHVREAALRLINKQHFAFLSSLFYDLAVIPDKEVDYASLDSTNHTIRINPTHFMALNPQEQATVLAKYIYHYALMHNERQGYRDPKIYKEACNIVVDTLLNNSSFELVDGMQSNAEFTNKATETVYKILKERASQEEDDDNNDDNGDNGDKPDNDSEDMLTADSPDSTSFTYTPNDATKGIPPADTSLASQEIKNNIKKADNAEGSMTGTTMSAGTSNDAFKKLFDSITSGKLPWHIILAQYLDELTQGSLNPIIFDRRFIHKELFLPGRRSAEKIEKITIAFDVSGSVSDKQTKAFLRELVSIKNSLNPNIIEVITFNHHIVDVYHFYENDDITKVHFKVGGGTNLHPIMQYLNKQQVKSKFALIFSDLYVNIPAKEHKPHCDVIWLCIDNDSANPDYGHIIHITEEELNQ